MKIAYKSVILVLVVAMLAVSLVSCIKGDTAKGTVSDFLSEVAEDDYEGAMAYLHPDAHIALDELFAKAEAELGMDFSDGITVDKYTSVRTSSYLSDVGGSSYETSFNATVGESRVVFAIQIVDNDAGYGIYAMEIGS